LKEHFFKRNIIFRKRRKLLKALIGKYCGGEKTKNKHIVFLGAFLVIWSCLTILAVTWETRLDWPDNVHRDYGFPFIWSTQTLNSIIGPVNLWSVDTISLIMDIAFWLALMLVASITMLVVFNKKS